MHSLRAATLVAALAGSGAWLARADDEPREAPPEPTDKPERSPRYIGADYGAKPARAFYPEDRQRIAAADEKRARKAAKRLALRPIEDERGEDDVRD